MEREHYIPEEELDIQISPEDSEQPPEVFAEMKMEQLDSRLNSLIARRELATVLLKIAIDDGGGERIQKNKANLSKLEREITALRLKMGSLRPVDQISLFSEQG